DKSRRAPMNSDDVRTVAYQTAGLRKLFEGSHDREPMSDTKLCDSRSARESHGTRGHENRFGLLLRHRREGTLQVSSIPHLKRPEDTQPELAGSTLDGGRPASAIIFGI